MEIDYVLLGLIKLYKEVTGYELNSIIRDSNQHFLSVSLAYIYPVLKRLNQRELVTYINIPITNRPDKKAYQITPLGEQVLQDWLKAPIEPDMYFSSFLLKMQFATLMSTQTVLNHIDREITRLQEKIHAMDQLSNCINSGKLDQQSCQILSTMSDLLHGTDLLRIDWLKGWRQKVEQGVEN